MPLLSSRAYKLATRGLLLTLFVWFLTIVLHEIEIGGDWDPVSFRTWSLLAAWLALFTAGYGVTLLHLRTRRYPPVATPPDLWVNRWVVLLALAGAAGAALVVIDFAIFRGYGFGTTAAAIRAEETSSMMQGAGQSSAVSGMGRLLVPAILPAYMLASCRWAALTTGTRLVLAVCSLLLIGEQLQFEGGRFFLTAAAMIVLACYFTFPSVSRSRRSLRKRPIPWIRIGILTIVLLSFFTYVFVDRILQRDDFFWSAYYQFARNFQIDVDYQTVSRFEGPFGPLWFSLCMLWVYITQGINELDLILSMQYFDHAYGLYQVPHIAQAVLVMSGTDFRYDVVANLPTVGSYATFYGHSFVDFGNTGALISGAILGMLTARAMVGFASGRLDALSIQAPILLILCLFTPIISLVTNLWPAMAWAAAVGISGRRWRRG